MRRLWHWLLLRVFRVRHGYGDCLVCGEALCPYGEPLHLDKDGCPSCSCLSPKLRYRDHFFMVSARADGSWTLTQCAGCGCEPPDDRDRWIRQHPGDYAWRSK